MSEILLSIISVTYNPGSSFLKTLESIISLKTSKVEFILVDGGSGPEFANMLKPYLSEIQTFISEKDDGIYYAMNKGWELAKGKYLLFINDGDELLEIPFHELKKSNAGVLLGPVLLSGQRLIKPQNSTNLALRNTWPHQGTFYARTLPFRYSSEYKIFSDFDLNQKLKKAGVEIDFLDPLKPIAFHDTNGVSHKKDSLPELYQLISKNHGLFAVGCAYINFKFLGLKSRLFI